MLATALAFGLLSEVAEFFSESYGASFVFPPAGVSLAASVAFGPWGVLGVLVGVAASPWGAAAISPLALVLFSLVHASAALIPALTLRRPSGPTGRRLARVVLFGVALASFASGILGTLSLAWLGRLEWSTGSAEQQSPRLVGRRHDGLPHPGAPAAARALPGESARRLRPAALQTVAQRHPADRARWPRAGGRRSRAVVLVSPRLGVPGLDGGGSPRAGRPRRRTGRPGRRHLDEPPGLPDLLRPDGAARALGASRSVA